MLLDIEVHLNYRVSQPTDLLLQLEAADMPDQIVRKAQIDISEPEYFSRIGSEDNIGERIWARVSNDLICTYSAQVEVTRKTPDLSHLSSVVPHSLSGDLVRYLMPSRYCPADTFQSFVHDEFGAYEGGQKVMAMRDWISSRFEYAQGWSNAQTTALDTFVQRRGVCRDYAHVMIALARAATIPARFASVYGPNVSPQDFHAIAEVYLEGGWHLIDATGMSKPEEIVRIGVGMDAAGTAFLNSFGDVQMIDQSVNVSIIG